MKVSCLRENLLTACQMVNSAVAARTTRPILANIKAIAQEDMLILMATDLEIGIRYELRGVKVSRTGMAILPPGRLISILRETTDEDITLDVDGETTRIRLSTGRYEMPGGFPDEFPDLPPFDASGRHHELTAGTLRTLIRRTAFAAERKESTRWAVTGILWEAEGEQARLVATDTKRLAITEGPATIHGEADAQTQSHLVPAKAIQLLDKNLNDDGELIRVSLKTNEAIFQTERALIHTKLVEGRFPPYRDIIPKKHAVQLPISVSELLVRVRQAAIMTDAETKRVDFHFEMGRVVLAARGPETGSSEVEMRLPEYTGPVIDIAFDPAYLIEMLRAIEGEPTTILEMTDGMKPAVFRVGENYLYLVMPLAG
ncbi:MAG: DNA polymerase III subunit beta [Bacteroidales bacterium]|nr:DNA polymerase III subunit beta [Bacteroidales bacterium]